ncbi:alpha/beta hydrolase [Winogradskyella immobilis]|uniref:Alpha/beta hydrolase n=1 Tax=Winogradskyella immobilis TaxID=2816852 RepID=A0ABS8ERJ8_9FLAO|nr:alpha/beta hydrolase [Winogradskyella immobilis]MCC1485497.1 alpha/beta hydrolase [Winogradskyella immobilis]MCG0017589.1 alpha/beta hydrolase [Winogradskyella immobilis]
MKNTIVKTVGGIINGLSFISPKYASKKAINLFATPRKGRYNPEQNKIIESAFFEEFQVNNHSIATYRWPGKNKSVLLVHGWESNASRWKYILEDLKAQDYNIIAIDAPAHGKSNGKQFTAILYAEFIHIISKKHKPEIIIGHSVGGMAAIFSLHQYKLASVNKIITLGSPAHFTGVFNRYVDMMGYNKRIEKGFNRIVIDRYNNPIDYYNAANFTAEFIGVKGLIIHDKKDTIIPYEDALLFTSKFKNSELISTTGFGHGLRDVSLTSKIISFINK